MLPKTLHALNRLAPRSLGEPGQRRTRKARVCSEGEAWVRYASREKLSEGAGKSGGVSCCRRGQGPRVDRKPQCQADHGSTSVQDLVRRVVNHAIGGALDSEALLKAIEKDLSASGRRSVGGVYVPLTSLLR